MNYANRKDNYMERTEQLIHLQKLSEKLKYAFTGMYNPNRIKNLDYEQDSSIIRNGAKENNSESSNPLQRENGYSPE